MEVCDVKKRLMKKMMKRQAEVKTGEVPSPSAERKDGAKINIFYQFSQHQVEQQEIIFRIKNKWKAQGNRMEDLKDLVVYLKTEENKAYYIINNHIKGNVAAWE